MTLSIALDLDGVLYMWHYSIYKHFCEFKNFIGNQYEFWKYFNLLSHEEQTNYVNLPFLYSDVSPKQDVLDTLPLLAEIATIYYITARPEELKYQTEKFFDKYNFPFKENLIFTKDKNTYLRLHNIKYFLDDLPTNLEKAKGITDCYLFNLEHNRDNREGFNCVSTIKEFYEIVKEKECL